MMICKKALPLAFMVLAALATSVSAQVKLSYGVFSSGSSKGGGVFTVYSIAGQTAVGRSIRGDLQVQSGFWHVAEYGTPLDVAISSFTGFYSGNAVLLSWIVKSDLPIEGFNVYRSGGGDELFVRINEHLLESTVTGYIDDTVLPGESYVYRFGLVDAMKEYVSSDVFVDTPYMPLTLDQNYPNPFNPATVITYYIPGDVHVRLEIFDISGKRIRCLLNRPQAKGYYTSIWDGTRDGGSAAASGIYFCLLRAGKERISKKMVLLR